MAAIPLLWVVPLSIYLLTFVLAFSGRGAAAAARPVRPAAGRRGGGQPRRLAALAPGHRAAPRGLLAARPRRPRAARRGAPAGRVAHRLLPRPVGRRRRGRRRRRPPRAGGLPGIYEYPLGIVACLAWLAPRSAIGPRARPFALGALGVLLVAGAALRVASADADGPPRAAQLALGLGVVAALAACPTARRFTLSVAATAVIAVALPSAGTVAEDRTYYGVSRVLENGDGWHLLLSGTTVHGAQDPDRPDVPLTYYAPGGPLDDTIGRVRPRLGPLDRRRRPRRRLDGGRPRRRRRARLLRDRPGGDRPRHRPRRLRLHRPFGRHGLDRGGRRPPVGGRLAPGTHDLLVIDAFSSDAIPVHLLTREAVAGYERALRPDGLLVFHVSNRYFDLVPVVGRLADDAGLQAVVRVGHGDVAGSLESTAVALGTPEAVARLEAVDGWRPAASSGPVWTDDHADVLSVL